MISPIPRSKSSHRVVLILAIVCLLATFAGVILVAAHNDDSVPSSSSAGQASVGTEAAARTRIAERFGKLPLSFEINKGQVDQSVKFLSRGPGYDLFLTANEAMLTLRTPQRPGSADTKLREGSVLRLKMIGANAAPQVEGQDELPGKVNYF